MNRFAALLTSSAFLIVSGSAFAGVTGSVKFSGSAPAGKAIDMKSDPKCVKVSKNKTTNDISVKGGMLGDTLIYVKNPPAGKFKAKGMVKLDQIGCRYTPKVFGIMVKQKLQIINSDPTLHNIHSFAKRGEFNVGMPLQGQKITKKFKKAQVGASIKCDVHPWMQAYAGIFKHPFFATSDAGGKFMIGDLPDGAYDVVAWHPKLGEKMGKVTVAGGNGSVDFTFSK